MRPTVLRRAFAMAGVALIITATGVLGADDAVLDPDGAAPFTEDSSSPGFNLGDLCQNATASHDVLVKAKNGSGAAWANSAVLTLTPNGGATGTDAADMTVGVGSPNTLTLPSTWTGLASGTLSSGTAIGTYTVASSSVLGAHSANANWTLTGNQSTSGLLARSTPNVHVDWNVVSCDTNALPTVDAGESYKGDEGSAISLDGASATDSDGSIASVLWELDSESVGSGSCSLANATSLTTATITCTDNGTAIVKLTATDNDGASAFDTANVEIDNVAPTGTFETPSADVNEGSTFDLAITDPVEPSSVDAGSLTYAFDCGAGYGSSTSDASVTCTTAVDGPATLTVKGTIADKDGGSTEYTGSVVVDNVNPSVAAPAFASTSVDCGQSASLTGISFSDPGLVDYDWNVNINWGGTETPDTNYDTVLQGAQSNQAHTYAAPGTYTATVGVTDKDGGYGSNTAGITVNQTYTVGFLQPLDQSSPSHLIANTMKNGRVVPVKATVKDDCTGQWVTGSTGQTVNVKVNAASFSISPGAVDAVESFSDAGASSGNTTAFRWTADASVAGGGYWIYNLDSSGKGFGLSVSSTYQVRLVVNTTTVSTTYAVLQPTK